MEVTAKVTVEVQVGVKEMVDEEKVVVEERVREMVEVGEEKD